MDTWNPECLRSEADRFKLQNRFNFVFIAEFVERLPTIFPVNLIYRFSLKAELAIFFPHVLRARRPARTRTRVVRLRAQCTDHWTTGQSRGVGVPAVYELPTCLKLSTAGQNDQFRILRPKERVGLVMQRSVFRSRRSVIRWIFVQSGFDRSLVWNWICEVEKDATKFNDATNTCEKARLHS